MSLICRRLSHATHIPSNIQRVFLWLFVQKHSSAYIFYSPPFSPFPFIYLCLSFKLQRVAGMNFCNYIYLPWWNLGKRNDAITSLQFRTYPLDFWGKLLKLILIEKPNNIPVDSYFYDFIQFSRFIYYVFIFLCFVVESLFSQQSSFKVKIIWKTRIGETIK